MGALKPVFGQGNPALHLSKRSLRSDRPGEALMGDYTTIATTRCLKKIETPNSRQRGMRITFSKTRSPPFRLHWRYDSLMNTRNLKAAELKPVLKGEAAGEQNIDWSDPSYRFTLWIENGNYFSLEDHAEFDREVTPKLGDSFLKNKSRAAILDILEDRLYLYSLEIA
jgi:hypothetical protein